MVLVWCLHGVLRAGRGGYPLRSLRNVWALMDEKLGNRQVPRSVDLVADNQLLLGQLPEQVVNVAFVRRQNRQLDLARPILKPTITISQLPKPDEQQPSDRRQHDKFLVLKELRFDDPRTCHRSALPAIEQRPLCVHRV